MDEWGLNPSTVSAIGSIAVLVTFVGIYYSLKDNRKARNLQAVLDISSDFRAKWESKWEELLETIPKLSPEDRQKGEVGKELSHILNWLDWMGLMLKSNLMDNQMLFGSLGPPIQKILRESSHKIWSDMKDPNKGPDWWANVLFVARQPQINIDIEKEAEKLTRTFEKDL